MSDAPGQRAARLPPALVVRGAAEARAALALAAGRPVLLLSAPGAAGFLGAPAWRALVAAATQGSAVQDALCCADAAGLALAALRAGCRILVLDGTTPAFGQVAAAAAEAGALLLPARPPALDLATLDLTRPHGQASLARWLAAHPHDRPRVTG